MWYGKNDYEIEDECCCHKRARREETLYKIIPKQISAQELKDQLEAIQLKIELEQYFNEALGNK